MMLTQANAFSGRSSKMPFIIRDVPSLEESRDTRSPAAARVPKKSNEVSEIERWTRGVLPLLVETESAAGCRLWRCLSYLESQRVIKRTVLTTGRGGRGKSKKHHNCFPLVAQRPILERRRKPMEEGGWCRQRRSRGNCQVILSRVCKCARALVKRESFSPWVYFMWENMYTLYVSRFQEKPSISSIRII